MNGIIGQGFFSKEVKPITPQEALAEAFKVLKRQRETIAKYGHTYGEVTFLVGSREDAEKWKNHFEKLAKHYEHQKPNNQPNPN